MEGNRKTFLSFNTEIRNSILHIEKQLATMIPVPEFEKLKGRMNEAEDKVETLEKENQELHKKLADALVALKNNKILSTQNSKHQINIENIINLGIPHVAEQIFESMKTQELFKCLEVSETWNILAGNVLIKRLKAGNVSIKRWLKGRMFEACKYGETQVVRFLLERCNTEESGLNARDNDGWTPFMTACFCGHTIVVQTLLDHSDGHIELNASDYDFGRTAFTWACYFGQKDVVQLLLNHPAAQNIELDDQDHCGNTAWMIAQQRNHRDIEKLLVEKLYRQPNAPGAQLQTKRRKRLARFLNGSKKVATWLFINACLAVY